MNPFSLGVLETGWPIIGQKKEKYGKMLEKSVKLHYVMQWLWHHPAHLFDEQKTRIISFPSAPVARPPIRHLSAGVAPLPASCGNYGHHEMGPKQLHRKSHMKSKFCHVFFVQTFPEKSRFSSLKAMGQQAFTKGFHQSSVSLLVFTTCSDLHKTRWSCVMQPHSNTSHEIAQAETQTQTIWGAA